MNHNFLMTSIRLAALAAFTLLPGMACTYSATSPVVGAGGGNVAVQVYTQPGCAWIAEDSALASVYTSRFGRGSGAYWMYVRPNAGRTRTAPVRGYVVTAPSNQITGRSSGGTFQTVFQSTLTQYGPMKPSTEPRASASGLDIGDAT
jgi:hypothetical protein